MTQPTFDFSINPGAVMPEPGDFPRDRVLDIVRACVRPLRQWRGCEVIWATDSRPILGLDADTEAAYIVCSTTADTGIGCEELRSRLNEQTDDREVILVAQRQFTLMLRAFSLDPRWEAQDILKRVRFYINTDPARRLMVPTFALVDYKDIVTYTDKTTEGRALLAAALDIRMAYVEAADPTEQGEQGFAESASGTGELIP